jgi:hypothetical protein
MTAPPPVDSEASARLELRTTVTSDVCYVIIGLVFGLPMFVAGATFLLLALQPAIFGGHGPAGISGDGEPLILAGTGVLGLGMGWWMGLLGVGGAGRLLHRRPAIVGDAAGLRFHPSFFPHPLSWSQVVSVRQVPGGRYFGGSRVSVVVERRFWSTWACVTDKAVTIPLLSLRPHQSTRNNALIALWRAHRTRKGLRAR